MSESGVVNRIDGREHLEDRVYAVDIISGGMSALDVEWKISHACVLRDDVVGAIGFGDDYAIGLVALVEEIPGAQAASLWSMCCSASCSAA